MALYTVRSPSHITVRLQSAIEFYGKKQDAANQKYFVQKMTSLNEQIKTVLDRQQRINAKSNNALSEAQPQQRERSQPQTQNAFRAMRKENEVEFNKYTLSAQADKERASKAADTVENKEVASQQLKKDIAGQDARLKQRLAERKRIRSASSGI